MDGIDINNFQEMNRMKQLEEMKRAALSRILTKEALERLSRVRVANPQLAAQAELYLLQVHKSGKLEGYKITDDKLKDVLSVLSNESHDFNIRRK